MHGLTFRQRNGTWVVDYKDATGARKRISTGIKTEARRSPPADVIAAARDIITGLRAPQVRSQDARPKTGLTVSQLLDRCEATCWHPTQIRSQASVRTGCKALRAAFGTEPVATITFTRLEQQVAQWRSMGLSPATIKRRLAMLSKAFTMATRWTDDTGKPLLASKPHIPSITVANIKERVLSRDEEARIVDAIDARRVAEPGRPWAEFGLYIRFLMATGARRSEALEVAPEGIRVSEAVAYVTFASHTTKSGKARTLPIRPELAAELLANAKRGAIFGFGRSTVSYMLDDARRDAGIAGIGLHTLRHTVLTRLAQGGMDLGRLQRFAGHASPTIMMQRYVHLVPSDLDGALGLL